LGIVALADRLLPDAAMAMVSRSSASTKTAVLSVLSTKETRERQCCHVHVRISKYRQAPDPAGSAATCRIDVEASVEMSGPN
jgi:hypothetical protein